MARRPREDGRGAIHHVIAKGSGGESLVRDDTDREALLDRIGKTALRHQWLCLAYCLLDTHFHLIVVTPAANLGLGIQWMLAPYAREFNKRHERQGNLFHTRFYSTRIDSDAHLLTALVYVHLNPVRAGVVKSPASWRWSSYAATVGAASSPGFLATDAVLDLMHPEPESARLCLELAVQEALERDRTRAGVRHGV